MFVAPSWNADTRPVGTECLTGNEYLRFTPNGVSTKSKINNQQSKIIRPTDKHCVPTGRRTPHPHGFLQTWRPYRTLGLRSSVDTNRQIRPSILILTHRKDLVVIPPFHLKRC